MAFPLLFSPLVLGAHTLRNRIVSTPHATGWGHDGLLTDAEVAYHVRKAQGGCGLVMTFGSASVDPTSAAAYGSIALWDPRNDDALRALADGVHRAGALAMSQLTHMGRRGSSAISGIPLRAPSDIPERTHREVPVPLEPGEIRRIVERYGECAARLESLGWDGCDVISLGGQLVEQFFDPRVNTRTDEYGGSLGNRVRFVREAIGAVRAATSPEFLISFRMTADQRLPGGLTPQELREIALAVCEEGSLSFLSISGGTGETLRTQAATVAPDEIEEGAYNELAGEMRRYVGLATLVAGRILDAHSAERCLREQGVELVAMTRAIIADPDLPRKTLAGVRVRPCISINQGCIGRLYAHGQILCSINPAIREPELADLVPAARERTVLVIGAGVAGMEAALGAARRGHAVTLVDERELVGGRARLAALRRGRQRWLLYLDWLSEQLDDAGVGVRLGVHGDAELARELGADAIVLAAGSRLRAGFGAAPGVPVVDVDALLEHGVPAVARRTALIIDDDGGMLAPTAAELLAEAGFAVEIATSLEAVGFDIDQTQKPFVKERLLAAGVRLTPDLEYAGVRAGELRLRSTYADHEESRSPGLLVIAGHRCARRELRYAFGELELHVVGDALAPRHLHDAVAEGARAGAAL